MGKWLTRLVDYGYLLSDSFILYPLIYSLSNGTLAYLLSLIRYDSDDVDDATIAIELDRARALTGLISSTSITIVTLTFSLTVLSVQIAAQTYTPRLLDDFLKDPVGKIAISINLGAFVYCYTLLHFLYDTASSDHQRQQGVPNVAIRFLNVHFVLVCVGFVGFIHFFINGFRLENILERAATSSLNAAKAVGRRFARWSPHKEHEPKVPNHAYRILADMNGYVNAYEMDKSLLQRLQQLGVCCQYHPHHGEFVTEGSVIAYVWETAPLKEDSSGIAQRLLLSKEQDEHSSIHHRHHRLHHLVEEELGKIVNQGLRLSTTRESDFDVTLGIQQLSDIATKALSPAINDPHTAIQAMDKLTVVFGNLAHLDLGGHCIKDENGVIRISIPRRSFAYLLSITDSIRHYGCTDVAVCRRGMRMLGDIGGILKRSDRINRLTSILAQLEQWLIAARKSFADGSSELVSIEEVHQHVVDLLFVSDRSLLLRGESTETDQQDLETTVNEPTSGFLRTVPEELLGQSLRS